MPEELTGVPWWVIAAAALVVVALAVWSLRTLLRRRPVREGRLHGGYLVATAAIAACALALITVAFTMSYAALYEAASWLEHTQLTAINGGDLRFLFPVGIDAVIVYFLAMDLLMEWQGRRHPLNRWSAYGLSAITVILNVAQTDGSLASSLGHAGPPVVIILIAEGVAAWVRHLAGLAHGHAPDRIPVGRWIAHPVSTLKVARLMLGWGITSYPDALEREQQRQLAYAMLRHHYGRAWRRATPRHLKWMLDNGHQLDTAFALTRALTGASVAMTADEVHRIGGHPAADAVTEVRAAPTGRPALADGGDTGPATAEAEVAAAVAVAEKNDAAGPPGPDATAPAVAAPETDPVPEATGRPLPEERPAAAAESEPPPRRGPSRSRQLSVAEKRQRVRHLLATVPDITDEEIAGAIGVAPSTARRYRNDLSPVRGRGRR